MTTKPVRDSSGNGEFTTWTLESGQSGDWVGLGLFGDRCVEVFVTGGTVTIEGANADGADRTPFTLNDPFGNPLTFNANGMKQILETPRFVRAKAVGASAVINLWSRRTLR